MADARRIRKGCLLLTAMAVVPLALAIAHAQDAARKNAGDSCADRYQDSYADSWRLSRESWTAACQNHLNPEDILAQSQRIFISACRGRFKSYIDEKRIVDSSVWAYCAQGPGGESRLEAMFGLQPSPSLKAGATSKSGGQEKARKANGGARFYALVLSKGHRYDGTPLDGYILGNATVMGEYHDKAVPPFCRVIF